jgi:hypothetical protein
VRKEELSRLRKTRTPPHCSAAVDTAGGSSQAGCGEKIELNICGTIATTLVCSMEMKQRTSSPGERAILAALVVEEEKSLPSFLMMSSTRGRSIWIEGNGLRN